MEPSAESPDTAPEGTPPRPPPKRKLRDVDDLIASALAGGMTIADAARTANISDRTVKRRLKLPAFRRRVSDSRAILIRSATGKLSSAMAEAAEALVELLGSPAETIKLQAAKAILEQASRLHAMDDFEPRIQALERDAEVFGEERDGDD